MINFEMYEDMMDGMPKREKIARSTRPVSDRQPTQRLAENKINRAILRQLKERN